MIWYVLDEVGPELVAWHVLLTLLTDNVDISGA